MLHLLSQLLRDVLTSRIAGLVEDQVRFEPPDESFRLHVGGLPPGANPAGALNVYLVEVRENRGLRTSEVVRRLENGEFIDEPNPMRIDCHYLMSAWSPATASVPVEPTLDEQALLYSAIAALVRASAVVPATVYESDPAQLARWQPYQREDVRLQIAPAEGFAKLAEFWTAMGQGARWKPAVQLIATIPVQSPRMPVGGIVTTLIGDYRIRDAADSSEVWITVGGHVWNASGGSDASVANTWVRLETSNGVTVQTARTNAAGEFVFERLRAARYRLRTRVAGFAETVREVDVPTQTGEYDLRVP